MLNHQFKISTLAFVMTTLLSACDSKPAPSVQDVAATKTTAQGVTSTAAMQPRPGGKPMAGV